VCGIANVGQNFSVAINHFISNAKSVSFRGKPKMYQTLRR
jgi:hypothetical protein